MRTRLRHGGGSALVIVAIGVVSAGAAMIAVAKTRPATRPVATRPASDTRAVVPRLKPVVLPKDEPRAKDDDERAALLAEKLLSDPLDSKTRGELIELRGRLRRRDEAALDALARGLSMYVDIGPRIAAESLKIAAGNSTAVSLTTGLPRSLEKIAVESRASTSSKAVRPCSKCGDTHLAPCTAFRCNGSGCVACSKCGGRGVLRGPDRRGVIKVLGLCDKCGGAGAISCKTCGGTGSIACRACRPKRSEAAASLLPAAEVQELRKAICKSRWIRAGGIDLYTSDARLPSPK